MNDEHNQDNSLSLVNVGKLAPVATALVNRIGNAVGVWYEPRKIIRKSEAQVKAARIKAEGEHALALLDIQNQEARELAKRASVRLLQEEMRKQQNMEAIIEEAIPHLNQGAKPEDVSQDWYAQFFESCKDFSDEVMCQWWGRILAGEANTPDSISKRAIKACAELSTLDARAFTSICSLSAELPSSEHPRDVQPFIFLKSPPSPDYYRKYGIDKQRLGNLIDAGLITNANMSFPLAPGISEFRFPDGIIKVEVTGSRPHRALLCGDVGLTRTGMQLSHICGAKPIPGAVECIYKKWIYRRSIREDDGTGNIQFTLCT